MLGSPKLASLAPVFFLAVIARIPQRCCASSVLRGPMAFGDDNPWFHLAPPPGPTDVDREDGRGALLLGEFVEALKRNSEPSSGGSSSSSSQERQHLKRLSNRKFQTQGWRRKRDVSRPSFTDVFGLFRRHHTSSTDLTTV